MEFIIHFAFINFFSLCVSVFLIYSLVCFALSLSCESWGQWACLLESLPGASDISVYPSPWLQPCGLKGRDRLFLGSCFSQSHDWLRGRTVNQCEPVTTVHSSDHPWLVHQGTCDPHEARILSYDFEEKSCFFPVVCRGVRTRSLDLVGHDISHPREWSGRMWRSRPLHMPLPDILRFNYSTIINLPFYVFHLVSVEFLSFAT